MRSPLVPLVFGTLTVLAVAAVALLWALFIRGPEPHPPSEVVVGESPDAPAVESTDDGVVDGPPAVTDHDGDGTPDEDDPDLSPTEPPADTPAETPAPETPPTSDPPFACYDDNADYDGWGEDEWDDWWDDCLEDRFEDDDDDD
ncbi:hypothetical protein [Nocardiopsis oceani]